MNGDSYPLISIPVSPSPLFDFLTQRQAIACWGTKLEGLCFEKPILKPLIRRKRVTKLRRMIQAVVIRKFVPDNTVGCFLRHAYTSLVFPNRSHREPVKRLANPVFLSGKRATHRLVNNTFF